MADITETTPAANCMTSLESYVRTRKGAVLAAEILISFIVLICYATSLYGGYIVLAICEMVSAIIFFVVFMGELDKQFQFISWIWSDLIRAITAAALYLITSLICVIGAGDGGDGAQIAGGVFGLLAGILFAYDAYTIFLDIKSSRQHPAAPTDDRV